MTEASSTEASSFPTREQTLDLYLKIESTAIDTLRSGNAVENPLIDPNFKDKRHFISVDLNLSPSPVKTFLAEAIKRVQVTEPEFVANEGEHLHVTMAEVSIRPEGRRAAVTPEGTKNERLTAQRVKAFYNAIRDNYPDQKPVRLRFEKIMLTADPPLDPKQPEKRSISLVAAFTNVDDEIFKVRGNIVGALEAAGLTTPAPRHPSKVIFVSLGRFAQPPTKTDEDHPILHLISELNAVAPADQQVSESELEVISTATKTVLSTGHVFLWPRIKFDKEQRSSSEPTFLKPRDREAHLKSGGLN